MILNLGQSFRNKKLNIFTEEVNKVSLSVNNGEKIESINLTEIYVYRSKKL